MRERILRYTFVLLSLLAAAPAVAQTPADTTGRPAGGRVRGIQYVESDHDAEAAREKAIPLLAGLSLSGDVAGLVMAAFTPYGQIEAACRVNLKERFFPIFEMGWGVSDHMDELTEQHFKANAPYFRIGCDYNVANDRLSGNRIYVGARYAFSSFKYDLDGPALSDPVWGGSSPFNYKNISSTAHWGELVFGFQVKVWGNFHMGWSIRLKKYFSISNSKSSQPYYIPGFGTTTSSTAWGGTYNLIFDLNWGKKKKNKATAPPTVIITEDAEKAEKDENAEETQEKDVDKTTDTNKEKDNNETNNND